jgi:hypothetical protein
MPDADVGILIVLHEMLCYDKKVMMMKEKSTHCSGENPQLIALSSPAPLHLQCNEILPVEGGGQGDSLTTAQARARKPHKQLPLSFNCRRLGSITL